LRLKLSFEEVEKLRMEKGRKEEDLI